MTILRVQYTGELDPVFETWESFKDAETRAKALRKTGAKVQIFQEV